MYQIMHSDTGAVDEFVTFLQQPRDEFQKWMLENGFFPPLQPSYGSTLEPDVALKSQETFANATEKTPRTSRQSDDLEMTALSKDKPKARAATRRGPRAARTRPRRKTLSTPLSENALKGQLDTISRAKESNPSASQQTASSELNVDTTSTTKSSLQPIMPEELPETSELRPYSMSNPLQSNSIRLGPTQESNTKQSSGESEIQAHTSASSSTDSSSGENDDSISNRKFHAICMPMEHGWVNSHSRFKGIESGEENDTNEEHYENHSDPEARSDDITGRHSLDNRSQNALNDDDPDSGGHIIPPDAPQGNKLAEDSDDGSASDDLNSDTIHLDNDDDGERNSSDVSMSSDQHRGSDNIASDASMPDVEDEALLMSQNSSEQSQAEAIRWTSSPARSQLEPNDNVNNNNTFSQGFAFGTHSPTSTDVGTCNDNAFQGAAPGETLSPSTNVDIFGFHNSDGSDSNSKDPAALESEDQLITRDQPITRDQGDADEESLEDSDSALTINTSPIHQCNESDFEDIFFEATATQQDPNSGHDDSSSNDSSSLPDLWCLSACLERVVQTVCEYIETTAVNETPAKDDTTHMWVKAFIQYENRTDSRRDFTSSLEMLIKCHGFHHSVQTIGHGNKDSYYATCATDAKITSPRHITLHKKQYWIKNNGIGKKVDIFCDGFGFGILFFLPLNLRARSVWRDVDQDVITDLSIALKNCDHFCILASISERLSSRLKQITSTSVGEVFGSIQNAFLSLRRDIIGSIGLYPDEDSDNTSDEASDSDSILSPALDKNSDQASNIDLDDGSREESDQAYCLLSDQTLGLLADKDSEDDSENYVPWWQRIVLNGYPREDLMHKLAVTGIGPPNKEEIEALISGEAICFTSIAFFLNLKIRERAAEASWVVVDSSSLEPGILDTLDQPNVLILIHRVEPPRWALAYLSKEKKQIFYYDSSYIDELDMEMKLGLDDYERIHKHGAFNAELLHNNLILITIVQKLLDNEDEDIPADVEVQKELTSMNTLHCVWVEIYNMIARKNISATDA